MRIALDTIGCKLNQAETDELARQLADAGHCVVSSSRAADVYILNTCSVTQSADSDCRQRLRSAHRHNPHGRLVITGCYAQLMPSELSRIEGVTLIVGNRDKPRLIELLKENGCLSPAKDAPQLPPGQPGRFTARTRAFIKVQEGCGHYCSYCVVPLARGGEKSRRIEHVIYNVRMKEQEGYNEVVLTGTEIGAFRDNGATLVDLLRRILAETGIPRLRLSSLQPQEISSELLALWRDERLCPHFHLSLQSGSDSVLKRMRRSYSVDDYRSAVSMICDLVPDVAITTDVMVGFPGETKKESAESYNFCAEQQFARIHVFPFSPRPGTLACRMPAQVCSQERKMRVRRMLALARQSADSFRRQFISCTMPVLWETKSAGFWTGLTGNYVRVFTQDDLDLTNKIVSARLVEVRGDGMRGVLTANE
ncbi:MAG: tRNA (N(6)-L-threonylcarbamoyladenosine(37)-C(2))-methylthiotransferase MtaB [Chloroflexi bacterium]|nr:tRNA (N(6)-L-threonylcarbamoyladenosine(37)-C(2))-methylthiotransferase MtaB [Chloroflexota bacterium]